MHSELCRPWTKDRDQSAILTLAPKDIHFIRVVWEDRAALNFDQPKLRRLNLLWRINLKGWSKPSSVMGRSVLNIYTYYFIRVVQIGIRHGDAVKIVSDQSIVWNALILKWHEKTRSEATVAVGECGTCPIGNSLPGERQVNFWHVIARYRGFQEINHVVSCVVSCFGIWSIGVR